MDDLPVHLYVPVGLLTVKILPLRTIVIIPCDSPLIRPPNYRPLGGLLCVFKVQSASY